MIVMSVVVDGCCVFSLFMIIDCLCHLYVLTEFAHFVYKHVLLICYVCNLLCLVRVLRFLFII